MTPRRVCSECGESLAGKDSRSKTCKDLCRSARSRRLARQKRELSESGADARRVDPHQQAMAEIVRGEAPDLARDVMHEELRPIVRDAITEDTLRAIGDMVALTPRVVELLARDMESDDSAISQRAYTLVAKYTLGHPALVRPEDADAGQQIVVNFGVPRPGDDVEAHDQPIEVESDEMRECDRCGTTKPIVEFIANSHRCVPCHDAFVEQARAITEKAGAD